MCATSLCPPIRVTDWIAPSSCGRENSREILSWHHRTRLMGVPGGWKITTAHWPMALAARKSYSNQVNGRSSAKKRGRVVKGVQHYRQEATAGTKQSPLWCWRVSESRYPKLAKVAKKVFCFPATSTPMERLFSTARMICTKKRAQLSPEHVNMLVFLHQNRKYLESVR